MILATIYAVAIVLVVLLTAHAWHDYHHRPDRYLRRTNQPRTDTRQPVRHWTARWIRR